MVTELTPNYSLTEGIATIVGDYPNAKAGDTVKVYMKSVLSEIEQSTTVVETTEAIRGVNELFINAETSAPVAAPMIKTVNYIPATLTAQAIKERANQELITAAKEQSENDPDKVTYMQFVPDTATFSAGDQVSIESDLYSVKDITITL